MIDRGYRRRDVGVRLSWGECAAIVKWLPRTSAYHRSTHPRSWWYTPEIAAMDKIGYLLACGNWQRGGGQGAKPKPPKVPVDREVAIKTPQDLEARRRHQREHLRRRRAEIAKSKGG